MSSLPEPGLSRGDFLYQSICNWVQENYAESLSRDSVAALFNISANHLSRLFSQQGTMSFVDYVRWVRMAKARTILQKYHLPVGEVAKRCGYADSDYFSRLFRRQFGLTPGSIAHAFSDSQNVISAFNRSRILCGVVAANSDSRNVLLTSFRASWEKTFT